MIGGASYGDSDATAYREYIQISWETVLWNHIMGILVISQRRRKDLRAKGNFVKGIVADFDAWYIRFNGDRSNRWDGISWRASWCV